MVQPSISDRSSQLLRSVGMIPDAEFYSGGGVSTTYLDAKKLHRIFCNIAETISEKEADQFKLMIEQLPLLSPTALIQNLNRLERNKWTWDSKLMGSQDDVAFEGESTAFATLFAPSQLNRGRDRSQELESDGIRKRFLDMINETVK